MSIISYPCTQDKIDKLIAFLEQEEIAYEIHSIPDILLTSLRNTILDFKRQNNISFSGVGTEGDCIRMNMNKDVHYAYTSSMFNMFTSGNRLYISLSDQYDSRSNEVLDMVSGL